MTLTELQDYALSLQSEKTALENSITAKDGELAELQRTNLLLQKRNNELFMRVEQDASKAPVPENTDTDPEPDPEPTPEEFASKNFKEIMNK